MGTRAAPLSAGGPVFFTPVDVDLSELERLVRSTTDLRDYPLARSRAMGWVGYGMV